MLFHLIGTRGKTTFISHPLYRKRVSSIKFPKKTSEISKASSLNVPKSTLDDESPGCSLLRECHFETGDIMWNLRGPPPKYHPGPRKWPAIRGC